MVAFATVRCSAEDDADAKASTAALRKAWLPTGAVCGGQIVSFPAAVALKLPAIKPEVGPDADPAEAASAAAAALAAHRAALKQQRAAAARAYTGAVELKPLAAWALTALDDIAVEVLSGDANAFQQWLMQNMLAPRVLIATDKPGVPVLARALAAEFHDYAEVGVVPASNAALMQQFQITLTPAARVVKPVLKPSPDGKTQQLAFDLVPVAPQALNFNGVAGTLDFIAGQYWPRSAAPEVKMTSDRNGGGKDEL